MSMSLWGLLYLSNRMLDQVYTMVAWQLKALEHDERCAAGISSLSTSQKLEIISNHVADSVDKAIAQDNEAVAAAAAGISLDISKIAEEVTREDQRSNVLAEQKTFNDNCCMRCYSRFFFLFNQKIPCLYCAYNVCKQCCDYDPQSKHYICKVCQKQRELKLQSCEWFYSNVLERFKRFGSAKVVRSIYKRRTESDSENDSGYDPASRSNSLPNGRQRSRQSLQMLFGLDNKAGADGPSEKCDVIQEEILANERNSASYNTPYTCSVSTGRGNFEEVKDAELYRFRTQLGDVALSLKRTLENQSPDGAIGNSEQDTYEKMLDNHRLNISSQLSSLMQTLHIAVDNQNPAPSLQSQTAKHELIMEIVNKDVEQFLGTSAEDEKSLKLELDEKHDNYEDVLAARIIDCIVTECRRKEAQEAASEESGVRRSFTELANHATAEQLTEMLSESEAETSVSQHEDTPEMTELNASVCRKEMLQSVESGVYTDDGGQNATDSNEDEMEDDLDELVRRNLPENVISSDSDVFNSGVHRVIEHSGGDASDSDDTTLADRCHSEASDDDDEFLGAQCIRDHHIPLPSFDGSEADHIDFDDITSSCHDDDEEEEEEEINKDHDVDDSWCMSPLSSGLFADISAYDNFGKKKLGKEDGDGSTVLMFIPGSMNSPRVGNRDVDDLSDLSENDTKSDDDSDGEGIFNKPIMADSSIQTEELRATVSVSTSVDEDGEAEVTLPEISTEAEEVDPKFVLRPHNVKCVEGEMIRLECEVTGTEPVDIFWYKEMMEIQQLDDDERCNITVDAGRCVVEMFNLTKKDAGQYLCIGVNEMGKCSQSIQVVVVDNTEELQPPEMLKGLLDLETVVGQRAKFKCKVGGYPTPLVIWYKDHKRIKPSEKYNIQKIGNRDYVLTIDDIDCDDDCEIRVVARNIAGEAKSRAQLIVNDTSDPEDKKMKTADKPSQIVKHSYDHLYPKTSELLQLAQQVSATRGQVNSTAEDMLNSANELSSIHHHLDEMDSQLQSMETSISPSGHFICDDANNNDSFSEDLLRDDEELTLAANSVQQLTHKALDILSSADEVVQSERESHGMKRKSELLACTDVEPTESPIRRNARFYSDSATTHVLSMDDVFPDKVDCGLHQIDSHRYGRDFVVNSGERSRNTWAWQRRTKSLDSSTADAGHRSAARLDSSGGMESLHELKTAAEVDSSEGQENVNDQVYMAAGKVYSLEERIMQLEDRVQATHKGTSLQQMDALEHEVSQTVVQVERSAQEVAGVESSVQRELDEKHTSSSDAPPGDYPLNRNPDDAVCSIQGDMIESDLDSSRTEPDESLAMPSVKSLINKYAANSPSGASVKRVCSLTERSLPRTVREKLKQGYPAVVANTNVRGVSPSVDNKTHRRRLEDLFSEDESMSDSVDTTDDKNFAAQIEKSVVKISTAAVELRPRDNNDDDRKVDSIETNVPRTSGDNYVSTAVLKSSNLDNKTTTRAEGVETAPLSSGRPSPIRVSKPSLNSTIMARAAFWDTRITQGEISDSHTSVEFPSLPEDSFKCEDEIF